MTNKQFVLAVFALLVVVGIAAIIGTVAINRHNTDAKIKADAAIEQTRIEQEAKLERTRERMNAVPWYKGGENKEAAE